MADEKDIFKQLDDETDAFFDQLIGEAGLGDKADSPSAKAPPPAAKASPPAAKSPSVAAKADAPAAAGAKASPPAVTSPSAAAKADSPAAAPAKASPQAAKSPSASAPAPAKADSPNAAGAKAPAAKLPSAPAKSDSPAAAASKASPPAVKTTPSSAPKTDSPAVTGAKAAQSPASAEGSPSAKVFEPPPRTAPSGPKAADQPEEKVERYSLASDEDATVVTAPEAPPPPEDFSSEDLALREELETFYYRWKPDNLPNVNLIVQKYRGRNVSNLWAQLCLKYHLGSHDGVELLTRSIYMSSLFEYVDEEQARLLEQSLTELRKEAGGDGVGGAKLLDLAIQKGAEDGTDALLRALCFRGIPDDCGLRPTIWKVLLGYLPMAHKDQWNAIHAEKRALYASYREELLATNEDGSLGINDSDKDEVAVKECQDLLEGIRNDVERTRQDVNFFRKIETRTSLLALLFVYARLNPGVRYVQGMNEVAAVVLWVMSAEQDGEADAFWVFSELMVEIKEGFMERLDHTAEGVHALTEGVQRLLRMYDPDVARHLEKSELPPFVFILRWCTVLFSQSQDGELPDVARLWDTLLADPHRFEFVVYTCVALVIGRREALVECDQQFALAEVLQSAPHHTDSNLLLRRACAICAFQRRRQEPPFPPKAVRPQGLDELSEWAHEAAAMAQDLGAEVSKTIQENIAPVVSERANQVSKTIQDNIAPVVTEKASQVSAAARAAAAEGAQAAAEGAQAVQSWLQETAPARREAMESAQAHISSLWDSVRTGTQRLTSEYKQSEAVENATARLSNAVAASGASSIFARAAAAFASGAHAPTDDNEADGPPLPEEAPPTLVPVEAARAAGASTDDTEGS